ncbi:WXG100 family type VII secretion target [Amycolatopsis sp. lyj-112]|uniref:WXG100 family type VII secretion target n=1 Tax=Amycolatopsis sp. lyj-112 TaxID=2789288 RepID=UPI00397D3069
MTGTGYQADAAAMVRAVQGFEETASNAKTTMASLESELTQTLHNYKGDQAVAFWDLQRRLQEKMTVAVNELNTMSRLVHESNRNYSSGDEQVRESMTGVSGVVDQTVIHRLNP